jgi:Glyoxalase-like domain
MSDSIRLSSVAINCPNAAELAAGATRYEVQPNPDHRTVFADPAGHPFCLSTWEDVPP